MRIKIDQWEWEGMGILIVFPHTSSWSILCSEVRRMLGGCDCAAAN